MGSGWGNYVDPVSFATATGRDAPSQPAERAHRSISIIEACLREIAGLAGRSTTLSIMDSGYPSAASSPVHVYGPAATSTAAGAATEEQQGEAPSPAASVSAPATPSKVPALELAAVSAAAPEEHYDAQAGHGLDAVTLHIMEPTYTDSLSQQHHAETGLPRHGMQPGLTPARDRFHGAPAGWQYRDLYPSEAGPQEVDDTSVMRQELEHSTKQLQAAEKRLRGVEEERDSCLSRLQEQEEVIQHQSTTIQHLTSKVLSLEQEQEAQRHRITALQHQLEHEQAAKAHVLLQANERLREMQQVAHSCAAEAARAAELKLELQMVQQLLGNTESEKAALTSECELMSERVGEAELRSEALERELEDCKAQLATYSNSSTSQAGHGPTSAALTSSATSTPHRASSPGPGLGALGFTSLLSRSSFEVGLGPVEMRQLLDSICITTEGLAEDLIQRRPQLPTVRSLIADRLQLDVGQAIAPSEFKQPGREGSIQVAILQHELTLAALVAARKMDSCGMPEVRELDRLLQQYSSGTTGPTAELSPAAAAGLVLVKQICRSWLEAARTISVAGRSFHLQDQPGHIPVGTSNTRTSTSTSTRSNTNTGTNISTDGNNALADRQHNIIAAAQLLAQHLTQHVHLKKQLSDRLLPDLASLALQAIKLRLLVRAAHPLLEILHVYPNTHFMPSMCEAPLREYAGQVADRLTLACVRMGIRFSDDPDGRPLVKCLVHTVAGH